MEDRSRKQEKEKASSKFNKLRLANEHQIDNSNE
jgi:hypothetical protein